MIEPEEGEVIEDKKNDEKIIISSIRPMGPYQVEDGEMKPMDLIIQYHREDELEKGVPPHQMGGYELRSKIEYGDWERTGEKRDVNDLETWTSGDYIRRENELRESQSFLSRLRSLLTP